MRFPFFIYDLFEFITGSFSNNKVPVFIIGAPRSGSTLLYQSMASYFDFGYFNNFHHKKYFSPSLSEMNKRTLKHNYNSNFKSSYGNVDGEYSPSENWDFWYRFFRKNPQYVQINEINKWDLRRFKSAINSFLYVTKKHLLIKNLPCVTRIQPIINAFPRAYWIVIHRNILDNALSIAKMRIELNKDINEWYSVQPKGYEEFCESNYQEQIFKQIELINKTIISDLSLNKNHVSLIKYEEFCNTPKIILDKLNHKFDELGINIFKNKNELPLNFNTISNVKSNNDYSKKIIDYYNSNRTCIDSSYNDMINKFGDD